MVPVAFCESKEYNDQLRTTMKMDEFVDACEQGDKLLYLKDWHLVKEFSSPSVYQLPMYFCEDWINDFWDYESIEGQESDDYRFVYIGMKGSFTPLHKDVFRSYSWSTNISGTKKWYFIGNFYL